MTARTQRLSLLLLSTVIGCSASPTDESPAEQPDNGVTGGQTGEETVGCVPVATDLLELTEISALGFSAQELLELVGGEQRSALTWSDGTQTSASIELTYQGGRITFEDREFADDASGAERAIAEVGVECNDQLSIAAVLTFSTEDGAFAESWAVTVNAEVPTRARVFHRLDLNALIGTFVVTQVEPAMFDAIDVMLELGFTEGAWTGSVVGQATKTTGSGPDGSVSALGFDVATL